MYHSFPPCVLCIKFHVTVTTQLWGGLYVAYQSTLSLDLPLGEFLMSLPFITFLELVTF